jgi:hypothetical protein
MESTATTRRQGWTKPSGGAKYAGGVSVKQFRGWLKNGLRHIKLPNGRILTKFVWIDRYLLEHEVKDDTDQIADEILRSSGRG